MHFSFFSYPQPEKIIPFLDFLNLLKNEEDYFRGEQQNTKVMITRLRKIFYDKYGWNKELIRKAAHIEGRYNVEIAVSSSQNSTHTHEAPLQNSRIKNTHRKRVVMVKDGDWMNPNAGTVPEIYKDSHQQVILPSGAYCDMGHVLAGMDAYNNAMPVTPLPNSLMLFYKLLPHVNKNTDAATWLGDLSSTCGELFSYYINHKVEADSNEKQNIIDETAPAVDMLGNIDSYVIATSYDIATNNGMRVTDILYDYYCNSNNTFRKNRLPLFCEQLGLLGWNGSEFKNEKTWKAFYSKELKTITAFYVESRFAKIWNYYYAFGIWLGMYNNIVCAHEVVTSLLYALKQAMKKSESAVA